MRTLSSTHSRAPAAAKLRGTHDTNDLRDGALASARAALARCDWVGARHELEAVGPLDDPVAEAERLDRLGEAWWWLGRLDECIAARETAYASFDEAGVSRRAGQVALWLYEHHSFKGRPAIGSAWLRRARRSLDGEVDCAEYGHLLLREAEVAHGGGELDLALDLATAGTELGRRLRSVDLEAEGLQATGRILIDAGRPREGIAHLDEAMLFAVEGRLGPYSTGKVYCSLIGACEDLGDLRRAAEWTDATATWSQRHQFAVFPGLCRVKRAEVLQWQGDWARAEEEARLACDELAEVKIGTAGAAWAEVGEIRRRLGDLDGAEDAFARAEELGCTPSAGLALLRLAQGRLDAASAIVEGALGAQTWNRPARARVLPAAVQVRLSSGDHDGARRAAEELEEIARDFGTDAMVAAAAVARGRLELATGEVGAAGAALRDAIRRWQELDVPYEAATAQLLLGQACREAGDVDGERAAFAAAAAAFERLGAADDTRRLRELASRVALPCGLTAREVEVLRLVAEGRTNKEIAAALGLSQKTVARHLSNIFVKINVTTRSAATAFAFARGLAS